MSKSKLSPSQVQSLLERVSAFDDSDEICELLRAQFRNTSGYGYVEAEAADHIQGLWSCALELSEALKALTSESSTPRSDKEPNGDGLRLSFDQIEREIMEGKHTVASVFTRMRTVALYAGKGAEPEDAFNE